MRKFIYIFTAVLAIVSVFLIVQLHKLSTNSINPRSQNSKQTAPKILSTPHFIDGTSNDNEYGIIFDEGDYIQDGNKLLINLKKQTFQNRHNFPECNFQAIPMTDGDKKNNTFTIGRSVVGPPTPVVFICRGRSGSSNTWMTMSKLAGGVVNLAEEHVGATPSQVRTFMNQFPSEESASWWVKEHLCQISHNNTNSNIAGFQWKPYSNSYNSSFGMGVLKGIQMYNSNIVRNKDRNNNSAMLSFGKGIHIHSHLPTIKVIFMTRNEIDVFISNQKHNSNKNITAHCEKDDGQCLEDHHVQVHLPIENLLHRLKRSKNIDGVIETKLKSLKVDYYRTTYEKLYYGGGNNSNVLEWKNLMSYLGYKMSDNFTIEDIEAAFPYSKTSKVSRNDILSNYDEVVGLLEGTEFQILLKEEG